MSNLFGLLLLILPSFLLAQQIDYHEQDGHIAKGYDVVTYFDGIAKKGKAAHTMQYDGGHYKFSSAKNLETFKANPEKYKPQFGGWCAYAMAYEQKVEINPDYYEVRNGKLYLFYKSYFSNAFKNWKAEGPEDLAIKAIEHWEKVKFKK